MNSSFEIDNNPSIDGWIFWSNTSSSVNFDNDVPPGGGSWSVVLTVGDLISKALKTTVAVPVGKQYLRLSVWAKSNWSGPRGTPSNIVLSLNGVTHKTISITDSVWKYYEVLDTITAFAEDSLTVMLNSGDAYGFQQTLFDLCRLELIK